MKKEHKQVVEIVREKYHILVIGSGGTGTNFLRDFNRYIARDTTAQSMISSLTVADGDTVEEKNLDRQCFLEEDLGRNKASVFAEVLNANMDMMNVSNTFRTRWNACCEYLTDLESIKDILGHYCHKGEQEEYSSYNKTLTLHIPIIIGCVDNDGCRILCEKIFNELDYCFYYDSGNEMRSGEVVFAHRFKGKTLSYEKSKIFPQMLYGDTRQVTEFSCAELNQSVPQHFLTNVLAGHLLFTGVINIFTDVKNKNILERIKDQLGYVMFDAFSFYQEFIPYNYMTIQKTDEESVV